jgi:hypothetical protein
MDGTFDWNEDLFVKAGAKNLTQFSAIKIAAAKMDQRSNICHQSMEISLPK